MAKTGFWGTSINHRTKHVTIKVIFPKDWPPIQAAILEGNRKHTHLLDVASKKKLPDGRWMITWEKRNPRLYENYVLNWLW